jgi:hypothetical protein
MSPASYRAAPPRGGLSSLANAGGTLQTAHPFGGYGGPDPGERELDALDDAPDGALDDAPVGGDEELAWYRSIKSLSLDSAMPTFAGSPLL